MSADRPEWPAYPRLGGRCGNCPDACIHLRERPEHRRRTRRPARVRAMLEKRAPERNRDLAYSHSGRLGRQRGCDRVVGPSCKGRLSAESTAHRGEHIRDTLSACFVVALENSMSLRCLFRLPVFRPDRYPPVRTHAHELRDLRAGQSPHEFRVADRISIQAWIIGARPGQNRAARRSVYSAQAVLVEQDACTSGTAGKNRKRPPCAARRPIEHMPDRHPEVHGNRGRLTSIEGHVPCVTTVVRTSISETLEWCSQPGAPDTSRDRSSHRSHSSRRRTALLPLIAGSQRVARRSPSFVARQSQ